MPTFAELYGDGSARCDVAISNSYDACGTITRSNIAYATPTALATIFQDSGTWRDMKSLLATQLELKACGIKRSGIYDWLMSSAKGVGKLVTTRKVKGSDSILEPFILASQKSLINDDYWAISNGWDGNDGLYDGPLGAAPGTAAQKIVRIISRAGLDGDAGWFPPRSTVHIFSKTSGGTAQRGQWKVEDVAIATDSSYADVLLTTQNANSSTPYDTQPGQTVDDYFHAGVVVIGTNNVSDWESWCNNRPALNPNRNVPFWFQTSRSTLCVDDFYKEWLEKLMSNNPLFAKFGDVSLAERNKQLGALFQREWLWSFFFGKPLANQSLANWQSLESINSYNSSIFDTGTENKLVQKRANAIGVYEQLRTCGRIKDLQGQTLNLEELWEEIYNITRSRSSQGKEATSVDIYTDSRTAAQFQSAMIKYYDGKASGLYRFTNEIGGKAGVIPRLGLRVKSYELVWPQGVVVNILTDNFFDDILNAATTETDETGSDITSTARFMMILDLGGGVYPGVINSKRKVHRVGELEDLAKIDASYACVMENPTREVTLNSLTWTAIVDCPSDNLIIENFDAELPDHSGKSGTYTDLYT